MYSDANARGTYMFHEIMSSEDGIYKVDIETFVIVFGVRWVLIWIGSAHEWSVKEKTCPKQHGKGSESKR